MNLSLKAKLLITGYIAAALTVGAFKAYADEIVDIPQQYRVIGPAAAADRERSQAVNGAVYTVVTPIFYSNGNTSYLRLANVNPQPVVVTVLVVGSPSGMVYGTAYMTIPPMASKQFAYTKVLAQADVSGFAGGDNNWSFYLRAGQDLVGFQHVIHNADTRFFENMSACTWDPNFNYTGLNRALGNVHTTSPYMVDYPSAVMLHHYGPGRALYQASLYASETGEYKGGFSFFMDPNESFIAPMSWYEEAARWTPEDAESHMNIVFSRADGEPYQAVPGHAVYNLDLKAYVNMTQFCGVNR